MFWKRGAGIGRHGGKGADTGAERETGKVVAMDRFRSGQSLSPIRQAEAYWLALNENGAIPRRTQIDPRALENILPRTFILERIAPGLARFRLAGQHLCELAGMEVRGMPFSAFCTAASPPGVAALLERLFDTPAIVDLTMSEERRRGATAAEARAILLPLASDDGVVNRALGVLIATGASGRAPLRLDLTGHSLRPVPVTATGRSGLTTPVAGLAPSAQPGAPGRAGRAADNPGHANPGLAESQRPLAGRPPWLKVVK